MAQRRHHYEQAFAEYLRSRRIPYVAVDEARKALLPEGAKLGPVSSKLFSHSVTADDWTERFLPVPGGLAVEQPMTALKSFDFVIYSSSGNLLIDVKGRKASARRRAPAAHTVSTSRGRVMWGESTIADRTGHLESWVTEDDITSLAAWERLFGQGFAAAFAFVYWCDDQPPDGLFQEIIDYHGRWYAVRCIRVADYVRHMRLRSPRWRTVHLPAADFERLSSPLAG